MSQTRATSKVFRQALAWILALAGYETTPAEERADDAAPPARQRKIPTEAAPRERGAPVRTEAVRLWNAHPAEAAEFARANDLPVSVADLRADQMAALVEHLRSFG